MIQTIETEKGDVSIIGSGKYYYGRLTKDDVTVEVRIPLHVMQMERDAQKFHFKEILKDLVKKWQKARR